MRKQLLIFVLMLIGASNVFADEVEINGLWYILSGNTAGVIKYKDDIRYSGDIVIPSKVKYGKTSYDVTTIESWAFVQCSDVTSVVIPNSVTAIGDYAFASCSGMTSITIPNSVSSIGTEVFSSCSSLTSITIPNSVSSLGKYLFSNCSSLTTVSIPNGVTFIGICAFAHCQNLTSVVIPGSVTKIREYAFQGCKSLTDVYCYAETVPTTDAPAFGSISDNTFISNITLHVPAGSVDAYEAKSPWIYFKEVVPLTDGDPKPAGIKAINVQGEETGMTYDLSGRKAVQLQKGLFIKNGKKFIAK